MPKLTRRRQAVAVGRRVRRQWHSMRKREPQTVKRAWCDYRNATTPAPRLELSLKMAFYAGAAWMAKKVESDVERAKHDIHKQILPPNA